MQHKIKSVLELSKYKVGDTKFWVTLRPIAPVEEIKEEDKWMERHHPKALFERGLRKSVWTSKAKLPHLQHMDFSNVMTLLTSKFVIEPFAICDLTRSVNTGEFFYENDFEEWMPESMLFDTAALADKEKQRILSMITKWIKKS